MTLGRALPGFVLLCGLCHRPGILAAEETNVVQFSQAAPYSSEEEIGRRFGYRPPLPAYDITHEKVRFRVPAAYSTNTAWGLLVWISPSDEGYLPKEWEDELVKQSVILMAPLQSGNKRHPIDRLRLALDTTCNACRKYRIDRKRIYVGGFSGGGRIASMLGIACGDIFTGTLCVCGVNFHMNVKAGEGTIYPGMFFPTPEILQYSRLNGRFVLLTGEQDPNHDNIKAIVDRGFKRESFKNVLLVDSPEIQHAIPAVTRLTEALAFLDCKTGSAPTQTR